MDESYAGGGVVAVRIGSMIVSVAVIDAEQSADAIASRIAAEVVPKL